MNYVESFDLFGVQAKQIPTITGSGAPTTATGGAIGCLYMDTDTGNLYKCTAAASGVYTWVECESGGVVKTVNGTAPDQNGNVEVNSGSGLSSTAKTLLITILRNGIYSTDQSANITALETELASSGESGDNSGGEEEPDTPVVPEATLSGISATYSGGDVAVGTAVTALTGVVVTATYSDGSTKVVTGYTLSGTIAEGSNTITVSYGGKTTTFTVTGVTGSSGDSEPIDAYSAYEWTEGIQINSSNGVAASVSTWSASEYIDLSDLTKIEVAEISGKNLAQYSSAFFDASQVFVSGASGYVRKDNETYPSPVEVSIPDGAAYVRFSGMTTALTSDGSSSAALRYYIYK